MNLKRTLLSLSLLFAAASIGVWLATGAHRGWTRTSVTVMEVEEVTGLEFPVRQDKFVMGVELLGAGLVIAAGFAGASLFFRSKPDKTVSKTS